MKNFIKKLLYIFSICILMLFLLFNVTSHAAPLTTMTTDLSSSNIKPGENVTLTVDFGQNMGAYTLDFAYDNALFDFVSTDGGTFDDNGTRVRVFFFDSTGGTSPKNSMQIIFKAKDNLITTVPTEFAITAEGLSNSDASVVFDDIGTPILKDIVIEPNYSAYNMDLSFTGEVIADLSKDMKLSITSSLGKPYSNTRILVEATSTSSGTAILYAQNSAGDKVNILESGYGDAAGDSLGGVNVVKDVNLEGIFNAAGTYSLTFKIIDRDNADAVIAENTFNVTVVDDPTTLPDTTTPDSTVPDTTITEPENTPTELPKTGVSIYAYLIPSLFILILSYFIFKVILKQQDLERRE